MEAKNVLITGATGNVGYELFKKLKAIDNINIYAAGRDISKAKEIIDDDKINYVKLDLKDESTYTKALQDIDTVFLMRPPAISKVKKYIHPFLLKMKEANIKQVVFLSLQGGDKNILVPHYRIERYIENLDLPHTFLRPSFFMQNLSTTHLKEIKEDNEIFIPAGQGKTNFIDVRDIAEVAKKVILEENHLEKGYELTGPDNLDYNQIAEIMSDILDEKIEYKNPSIFQFYKRKRSEGYSVLHIIVMIGLYSVTKFGLAAKKTDKLKQLLDREPISFEKFVRDNKEVWY
ncbi:MAG: NmrA family NAD(P)-binding protein [Halanaerobiales bacterium]